MAENSRSTVAALPRNQFTEMIERASAINKGSVIDSVVSAGSAPNVRSASFGPVVPVAEPLSAEEKYERDLAAAALGLIPEPPNPFYSPGEVEVGAKLDAVDLEIFKPNRVTAREFLAQQETKNLYERPGRIISVNGPRVIPDFSKVQMIDLVHNVVCIDGMDFPIPEEDVQHFRVYAIETARMAIMSDLDVARALLAPPEKVEVLKDGKDTGQKPMLSLSESECDTSSNSAGIATVQHVQALEQLDLFRSGDAATVKARVKRRRVKKASKNTNKS